MTNNQDGRLNLRTTHVEYQDVKQEAELLKLQGRKDISLRIVYNMLASTDRLLYYGTYDSTLEFHIKDKMPWSGHDTCESAVITRLVDWALEQDQVTQEVIFSFLDYAGDKDSMLSQVLETLGIEECDCAVDVKSRRKTPMSEMMRKALPADKDTLIRMIQRVSPETKRPAATVRQWLRQDMRKGKIKLGADDRYYHNV